MQAGSGLSRLADQEGFLVAYPQGLRQPEDGGRTGWDPSGPLDPYAHGIDDGLFVSDVLNAIQAGYCVDPRRIAATGISNGGSMTGYLACVLAGRIAAFMPVEGVFFQIPTGCHPVHPAAILDVHVPTDPVAPYAGVPSRGSPDYYALAIPAWLHSWALRDGCRAGPEMDSPSPWVTVLRWTECPGSVAVTGYRLAFGGHSWFRALGALTGDKLILRFLAAHPLTRPVPHWSPRQAALVPALTAPRIAVASLRQFDVPTARAEPFDITAGPDGSMWFTEFRADKIGRISPSGKITEYQVPTPGAEPYQITIGPDRSVWFTEYNSASIGRVTPSGRVTQIKLPHPSGGGAGIASGPGAAVWVSDPVSFVDRINPAGRLTRTKLPAGGFPFAIAATRTGEIFLNEGTGYFEYSRVLLRLRLGSAIAPALTLPDDRSNIDALATGPHGAVWFTDFGTSQIGELLPGGRLRLFPSKAPTPDSATSPAAQITLCGSPSRRASSAESPWAGRSVNWRFPYPAAIPTGLPADLAARFGSPKPGPARSRASPCANLDSDAAPAPGTSARAGNPARPPAFSMIVPIRGPGVLKPATIDG